MSTFSGGEAVNRIVERILDFSTPTNGTFTSGVLYTVPSGTYAYIDVINARSVLPQGYTSVIYKAYSPNGLFIADTVTGAGAASPGSNVPPFVAASSSYVENGKLRLPEGCYLVVTVQFAFALACTLETRTYIKEWIVPGGYVDLS
jgi:hypothetical protein